MRSSPTMSTGTPAPTGFPLTGAQQLTLQQDAGRARPRSRVEGGVEERPRPGGLARLFVRLSGQQGGASSSRSAALWLRSSRRESRCSTSSTTTFAAARVRRRRRGSSRRSSSTSPSTPTASAASALVVSEFLRKALVRGSVAGVRARGAGRRGHEIATSDVGPWPTELHQASIVACRGGRRRRAVRIARRELQSTRDHGELLQDACPWHHHGDRDGDGRHGDMPQASRRSPRPSSSARRVIDRRVRPDDRRAGLRLRGLVRRRRALPRHRRLQQNHPHRDVHSRAAVTSVHASAEPGAAERDQARRAPTSVRSQPAARSHPLTASLGQWTPR